MPIWETVSEQKYVSRMFLGDSTHSTANIQCFFDPRCPNAERRMFISISDCNGTFVFSKNKINFRTVLQMRSFISQLLALIAQSNSTFSVQNNNHQIKCSKTTFNKVSVNYVKIRLCNNTLQNSVTIHGDPDVCSESEWQIKQGNLIAVLNRFLEFITGQYDRYNVKRTTIKFNERSLWSHQFTMI